MKFTMKKMPINLSGQTPLNVDEAAGCTVRVVAGRVWITQEGSVDDVFLDAGAGHTFRTDGKVVISAEGARNASATVVFDAPVAVTGRDSLVTSVKRWMTLRPAPLSTASNVYEGV